MNLNTRKMIQNLNRDVHAISLPFNRPYRSTGEVQQDKITDSEEHTGSAPRWPDNRCHKALLAAKINIHRQRQHVTRVLSAACHHALLQGPSRCARHCRTAEVTPRNTGSLCKYSFYKALSGPRVCVPTCEI